MTQNKLKAAEIKRKEGISGYCEKVVRQGENAREKLPIKK